MSKEAVGQFSNKIGSSDYWSRLNHGTLLGRLMDSKTDYQATLRSLGEKASKAINEIYEDLCNLGTQIRFLPSSDRNALVKQVEELYDVCEMGGVQSPIWEVHNAIKKSRREFQRTVWKLGAEHYLRPSGYNVAALLLEHSLKQLSWEVCTNETQKKKPPISHSFDSNCYSCPLVFYF